MQDFQDNNLDDFFRKASQNTRVPFNPESWKLMEKKLEEEDAHKRVFYKRLFLSGVFLVFTASLISLYVFNHTTKKSKLTAYSEKGVKETRKNIKESDKKSRLYPLTSSENESTTDDFNPMNKAKEEDKKFSMNRNKQKFLLKNDSLVTEKKIEPPASLVQIKKGNRDLLQNKPYAFTKGVDFRLSEVDFVADSILNTFKQKRKNNKNEWKDLLRINLLVSPDFSSTFPFNHLKSGYNTGITVEYFIFKDLSVSAGVLRSNKLYSAAPDSYKLNGQPGYGYNKPEEIKGNCVVTDIPVNIRYFYCDHSKIFRGFVSAGISSYLMRKEDYTFYYSTYDKSFYYKKSNNHLFSVVNLSSGGEFRIAKNLAIGIEPFIKLATTGVGEGKIKLNSAGAFLSVNYTILKQ